MNLTQSAFLFLVFACLLIPGHAQISDYSHPPMILGQEGIEIKSDSILDIGAGLLFIHDTDNADRSAYEVIVAKGEHYSLNGKLLTPESGFNGILHVEVKANDGEHLSEAFDLEVKVHDDSGTSSYELSGQETASTQEGIAWPVIVDQLKVHCFPGDFSADFYVSTEGDDANPGTMEEPLATLAGAKAKVKTLKLANGMPEQGITVVFREGDYYISSAVNFDAGDSGDPDKYITYRAYPNERVRFTGAMKIEQDWLEAAPADISLMIKDAGVRANIRMVRLKDHGITSYGTIQHVGYTISNGSASPANIFVDGKAMHLCRYPNTENFDDVLSPMGLNEFTSHSGVVNTWNNTGDLWIDGALSKPWEWQKNNIATISPEGVVKMTWDYKSEIGNSEPKMFYYNMIEELDYPGEYFLDRSKGILYFYPPEDMDRSSEIRISQSTSQLMILNNARNLAFIDLHFEGTRSQALQVKNGSSYNRFINCEISCVGLDGMYVYGTGNLVLNTHVHDIGKNGIYLDGGNQASMTPARNLVENCLIHDFSQEQRAYNPGLTLFGTGQVVRHTEIYNGPHMGVKIKGNNHLLEYNNVHRLPHEYSDMLAIYFNTGNFPLQRGTIIRRNRFHDVSGGWKRSAGVYMDNETCGVLVEENYFYDNGADSNGWSVMVHGGADNIVRKNVFVYTSYPYLVSLRLNGYAADRFEGRLDMWQTEFRNKAKSVHFKYYPELNHYFDDEGVTPEPQTFTYNKKKDADGNVTNYWDRRTPSTNVFTDNLVYNESEDIFKMPNMDRGFYVVSNFQVIDGIMQENLISGNNHNQTMEPGFKDYINRDLAFDTASLDPALKAELPHLATLPFYQMGLTAPTGVAFNEFTIDKDSMELIFLDVIPVNYTRAGNLVQPDPGFFGELSVPVKVRIGDAWVSDTFNYKIDVYAKPVDLPKYILLSPKDTLINKGDTLDYQVEIGLGLDPSLVYSYVSDPAILGLDGDGVVKGLKGGEALFIVATTDLSLADTIRVEVYEEELPKYILLTLEDTAIFVGDTLRYSLDIGPGLDPDKVNLYSDNYFILSPGVDGSYIGRKAGEVNFIAYLSGFSYADTSIVTVKDLSTGLNPSEGEEGIQLYPNPVKEQLHIIGGSEGAQYSVISAPGSILIMVKEVPIDVSHLAPGYYLLRVDQEGQKVMKRFIKE